MILISMLFAGCNQPTLQSPTLTQSQAIVTEIPPKETSTANSIGHDGNSPYLVLNEKWLDGQFYTDLDINDIHEVFGFIFSQLPTEVFVYPTENYYYFILHVDKREFRGNIALSARHREQGLLSFGYFEFNTSPYTFGPTAGSHKFFDTSDGVHIEKMDDFNWNVRYEEKTVMFHLNQITQEPPKQFVLADTEIFVERIFDESGYQFFLIFNSKNNFFMWVLNEEVPMVDRFEELTPSVLIGRKSGFVFWEDASHGDRKVLAAIRRASVSSNDYYDGPFDQLADNYVDQVNIKKYMQLAYPQYVGRIDKFGYVNDSGPASRVSISPYFTYADDPHLKGYISRLMTTLDPLFFISTGGRLP